MPITLDIPVSLWRFIDIPVVSFEARPTAEYLARPFYKVSCHRQTCINHKICMAAKSVRQGASSTNTTPRVKHSNLNTIVWSRENTKIPTTRSEYPTLFETPVATLKNYLDEKAVAPGSSVRYSSRDTVSKYRANVI
jgi:hypothetical protein